MTNRDDYNRSKRRGERNAEKRTKAAAAVRSADDRRPQIPRTTPGQSAGPPPPRSSGPKPKRTAAPKGGGGGGGGGAAGELAAAMARAGARSQSQSANLDPQIAALRYALDTSFKQALDQDLSDLDSLVSEQFEMLKSGASSRAMEFLASAKDNDLAFGGQAESNQSNLVRERQDSLTAVLEQGAGQTDILRAMISAARNWHSNAQEGNRAYFDSIQSVNQGITDLNVDTQSALGNVQSQDQSERERLWKDYYNRRSETFTNLGNLYTQQADYLDEAKEQKVGGGGTSKKDSAGTAFMDASKEAGKSYARQGLPDWIKNYKGQERVKASVGNTNLAAAMTIEPLGTPEGATLRKWG